TLDRGDVDRAREVVDDGVEQLLDALVAQSGTTEHGSREVREGSTADAGLELVLGDLVPFDVADHDLVVDAANGFDQLVAGGLSGFAQVLGNLAALGLVALFAAEPPPGHGDEVDDAVGLDFSTDGNLDCNGITA